MAKWGEGDPRWIVEERPDATNVNNWHWTEKNASDWSKNKFKELLVGLEMNFDADDRSPVKGNCRITEVSSADGEATANNRKAKLIFFFEWNLELKFEALLAGRKSDDEKITGRIEIPNLSDENSADEVEVNVKMDANDQDSFAVKEVVRKKFSALVKQALAVYIKQLKEEYSKTLILPTKQDLNATINTQSGMSRARNVLNNVIDKSKKENDVIHGRSCSLSISETFHCSARDLYNAFTMVEMVQAFTRAAAPEFDAQVGGSFKLFNGHIGGKFLSMSPHDKLSFLWRMKNWRPDDHHSQVDLEFKEHDGSTILHLNQREIPDDQVSSTEEGWKRYYFDAIKQTFGFGARIF
uniref:Activator of Hsp90 ATPase AHSA1-like N-terminal domain-containing protein n=1 Tax=Romanomermis culicivorax TaxID=13658 RepID=A0A915KUH3_ROMCU